MRCAYISLAAASLCWTGALALGSRHGRDGRGRGLHGAMMADQGHRGRVVMTGMDMGSNEQRQQNKAGNSGKDHGHAYHHLDIRQAGAQCGAQYGKCPGDLCCSDYGYCGDTVDHCAPLFDCQPQYGTCGWPRAPPAPSTTSTTSAPPPPTTTSTSTSTTPTTTSTTSAPPPPTTTSTTSAPPPPTTTSTSSRTSTTSQAPPTQTVIVPGGGITTNGQCGNGTMCIGNPNYGPCCSQFFWCGSALDFCGAGCRSEFGACLGVPGQPGIPAGNVTTIPGQTTSTTRSTTSTSTTTVPLPPTTTSTTSTTSIPTTTSTTSTTSSRTTTSTAPTPTVVIPPGFRSSTDGSCGPGVTCLGSTFGRCCSQFGFCGDSDQFCPYIVGCQSEYGYCDPKP